MAVLLEGMPALLEGGVFRSHLDVDVIGWVCRSGLGSACFEFLHGDPEGVDFPEGTDEIIDEGSTDGGSVLSVVQFLFEFLLDISKYLPVPNFSPEFFQVSFPNVFSRKHIFLIGTGTAAFDHPNDFGTGLNGH